MRLSKSKVLSWINCPFRYKIESVDGWKPDIVPKQLKKGIEIHDVLEQCIKDSKDIVEVRQKAECHKDYVEHKQDIDHFLEWQKNRGLPLYIEEKFFDAELNISGIVDRVDINKNGELVMIDYKSGKGKSSLSYYRFELALYVYLFESCHNQQIKHWGIYFTGNNKYLEEPVDRFQIKKAINTVISVRKEINDALKNNFFPKRPSALCGWCSLQQNGKCHGTELEIDEVIEAR